jgi:predicted lipid-binding transport protein (Tim44 family)
MRRTRFFKVTLLATAMLIAAGAMAQTAGTTGSIAQGAPAAKAPSLAPAPTMPAGTAQQGQPQQPLTNPALPPLNGQAPGMPLAAGTGQQPNVAQQPPAVGTPSRTDNPLTAFRALDPMNRGFVTRADTDKLSGFTGFDNADTNRDGQLSAEEFATAWKNYAK